MKNLIAKIALLGVLFAGVGTAVSAQAAQCGKCCTGGKCCPACTDGKCAPCCK